MIGKLVFHYCFFLRFFGLRFVANKIRFVEGQNKMRVCFFGFANWKLITGNKSLNYAFQWEREKESEKRTKWFVCSAYRKNKPEIMQCNCDWFLFVRLFWHNGNDFLFWKWRNKLFSCFRLKKKIFRAVIV